MGYVILIALVTFILIMIALIIQDMSKDYYEIQIDGCKKVIEMDEQTIESLCMRLDCAITERDSLIEQNEKLRKKIKKLKRGN